MHRLGRIVNRKIVLRLVIGLLTVISCNSRGIDTEVTWRTPVLESLAEQSHARSGTPRTTAPGGQPGGEIAGRE